jgi:iron complex outermembrane recepter protein
MRSGRSRVVAVLAVALGAAVPASKAQESTAQEPAAQEPAAQGTASRGKYSSMSLEDLLKVEITSVSGVAAAWFGSPAAITVITGEDLRRHGFRTLADALRMVPGMQVARPNAHEWAVSARGFNNLFANKLLVLVNGRQVYDVRFAGVLWDAQDVLLEDLDRIEVIRGPGATLWGANAVNGVINITTKRARDTQGLYLTAGGGVQERAFAGARYGGRAGERAHYRVWAQHLDRDRFRVTATGADGPDDWNMSRGGGRVEVEVSPRTSLTFEGELYGSERLGAATRLPVPGHQTFVTLLENFETKGGHLLFRLEDGVGQPSGWTAQGYYHRDDRVIYAASKPVSDIFDLDVRRHFGLGRRNVMLVGAGFRHVRDRVAPGGRYTYSPESRRLRLWSGFVQDTVALRGDLSLMVGSKFEDNDFTGFELQPSARLAWTPSPRHTVWAAVSRPVRTPARGEQDVEVIATYVDAGLVQFGTPIGVYVPIKIVGNPDLGAERLTAYELGVRTRITGEVSVDVALYHNEYRDRIGTNPRQVFGNLGPARGRGVEIEMTYRPSSRLLVQAAYTRTDVKIEEAGTRVRLPDAPNLANLRAHFDVAAGVEMNAGLYYVDALEGRPASRSHLRADLGLSWRPTPRLEIALWGQDLLKARHNEFEPSVFQAEALSVRRGGYLQVTLRK